MARGTAGLRPAWGLAGCVLVWWWLWDTAGFLRPCASGAPVPSGGAGQRALGVCWCGLERLEGVLLAGVWPLLSPDVCSCCVAPDPPLQMAQGVLGTGWALNLPLCPLLLPGRTPGVSRLISDCQPLDHFLLCWSFSAWSTTSSVLSAT